jgi:hypothetical protein
VRYVAQLTVPVLIQPREGIEVHRVLRVSASLYTISNTRHGQTLSRDTLGAAFRGVTAYGRKRFALTLWRCVGTVGTPATDTIVAYTRL